MLVTVDLKMRLWLSCVLAVSLLCVSACSSADGYIYRGNEAFERASYDEAVLNYRKAIQKEPQKADPYYRLGLAEMKRSDTAAAHDAFRTALAKDAGHKPAMEQLGELLLAAYVRRGSGAEALYRDIDALADNLLRADPRSFHGLRFKGALALFDRRASEAVEFFRKAEAVRPGDAELALLYAQALFQSGQAAQGESVARAVLAAHPAFTPMYDALANFYAASGRASDADRVLLSKASNNPDNVDVQLQVIRHLYRSGRAAEAELRARSVRDRNAKTPDAYLKLGDLYMEFGKAADAQQLYEAGYNARNAARGEYRERIVRLLIAAGNTAEAIRLVDQDVKASPSDKSAHLQRAALALASGRQDELPAAIQSLESFLPGSRNDEALHFRLGHLKAANGDAAGAKKHFEETIRVRAGHMPARMALIEIAQRNKDHSSVIRLCEDGLALQPDAPYLLVTRASAYIGLGRYDDARSELNQIASRYGRLPEAELQAGRLAIATNQLPAAERIFAALYKPGQTDLRALEGLSEIAFRRGQGARAFELWKQEAGKKPEDTAVRERFADAALRAGRVDEAIAQYKAILERAPGNKAVHAQLGRIYFGKGDLQAAGGYFERADRTPDGSFTRTFAAYTRQQTGNSAEAEAAYRRELKQHPDNLTAMNNLAMILAAAGSKAEALELAVRAVQKQPANPEFSDTLAYVYLKRNENGAALQILEKITRQYPRHPGFRTHMAMALLHKGDKARARAELQTALTARLSIQDEKEIRELLAQTY
jgi:predicted Zn-dependent protease